MKKTAREQMILKMMEMANDVVKNYTWEKYHKIWTMCADWNSSHESSEEIFMCDMEADEEHPNGGFYIEDDYWVFAD